MKQSNVVTAGLAVLASTGSLVTRPNEYDEFLKSTLPTVSYALEFILSQVDHAIHDADLEQRIRPYAIRRLLIENEIVGNLYFISRDPKLDDMYLG